MKSYTIAGKDYFLALIPVLALLAAATMLGVFANSTLQEAKPLYGTATATGEGAARLQILGTMLLFFLVALVSIGKIAYDIITTFDDTIEKRFFAFVVVGLLLCGAIFLGLQQKFWPEIVPLLGKDVFQQAFDQQKTLGGSGWWSFDTLNLIVNTYSLVIACAAIAIAVALISCLARLNDDSNPSLDEQRANWIWQSQRLQQYLYIGTAMLVLGILAFRAWTSYPAMAFASTKPEVVAAGKTYASLVDALSVYQGIQYSLVLAAIAVPVALRLSQEADDLAGRMTKSKAGISAAQRSIEVQQTKETQKLAISPWETVKLLLTILAPVIAGTLSSLGTVLK